MPTLYLTEEYALVRRDSEDACWCKSLRSEQRMEYQPAPARKEHIPLIKIDEVVVLGEITLTASAIHLLLERDIEITFLGHFGQFKGTPLAPFSKNAILRMAQYRAHQDMTRRCELARCFVIGKLVESTHDVAARIIVVNPTARWDRQLSKCDTVASTGSALVMHRQQLKHGWRVGTIALQGHLWKPSGHGRGGQCRLFSLLWQIAERPRTMAFPRTCETSTDRSRQCIAEFRLFIATNKVASAVQLVGFDHFVGYLHSSFYGRPLWHSISWKNSDRLLWIRWF